MDSPPNKLNKAMGPSPDGRWGREPRDSSPIQFLKGRLLFLKKAMASHIRKSTIYKCTLAYRIQDFKNLILKKHSFHLNANLMCWLVCEFRTRWHGRSASKWGLDPNGDTVKSVLANTDHCPMACGPGFGLALSRSNRVPSKGDRFCWK